MRKIDEFDLRRGAAVLALAFALTAIAAGVATAKPGKSSAPKSGGYSGLSEVKAKIVGKTISFKGSVPDEMGVIYPLASTVTLKGRFTTSTKFTATAATEAPAKGVATNSSCVAPPVKLIYELVSEL